MSRPMTHEELTQVLKKVAEENSPFRTCLLPNGKYRPSIKYVDPCFDNRTGDWFSITFRTMGAGEKRFHCVNEFREVKESLFERIMKWLDEGDQ
jgi:hypothetical protein